MSVSNITANLLVTCHGSQIDQADLIEALETNLVVYSFYAHRAQQKQRDTLAVAERDVTTESIKARLEDLISELKHAQKKAKKALNDLKTRIQSIVKIVCYFGQVSLKP